MNAAAKSKPYYTPETYSAGDSVGYLVTHSHSLMVDCLEPAFADTDFTFTQWKVLMNLREGTAVNAKQLCSLLRHDSGALTRLIDQLETRGLLERHRSRKDRREVELVLTKAGRKAVTELIPMVVGLLNEAIADFTHSEVDELVRMLKKLNATMQSQVDRYAARGISS